MQSNSTEPGQGNCVNAQGGPVEPIRRERGLTIIIPCLNEEKTITHVIKRGLEALERFSIPGEVLVVDNNSEDRSAEVSREAGARVIHETTRGYGAAYYAGVRESRFEYCIKADADGSYDLGEIDKFWERLEQGDADIVLGSRFKGEIKPGAMPFMHKYLGTPVLTMLVNLLHRGGAQARLSDINSGMRAFKAQTLLDLNLRCKGMEFASEMLIKALKKGLAIKEIPITLHPDLRDRKPHLKSFRDGWRHLRFILLMSPLRLFFLPGLASMLLGVAISLVMLAGAGQGFAWKEGANISSLFGITSFACVQGLIILGEVLIVFSFVSKMLLVQKKIDMPSPLVETLRGRRAQNRILLGCGAGLVLNLGLMGVIVKKLYESYILGRFTPLYTKLGIFNFTLFVTLMILFFTVFFVAGFEEE